jgi:hypothetical protein
MRVYVPGLTYQLPPPTTADNYYTSRSAAAFAKSIQLGLEVFPRRTRVQNAESPVAAGPTTRNRNDSYSPRDPRVEASDNLFG